MKSIRLYLLLFFVMAYAFNKAEAQGMNHQWLLGSNPFAGYPNGRAYFDSTTSTFISEYRKISFEGAEANICDANGNLLMSSNGVWIANANNDTMMNGNGLNPSAFTSNWPYGFPINFMNIIIPAPSDSSKYILFHQVMWQTLSPSKSGFYRTVVDMTLDSGLGGVIIKNDTLLSDTLSHGIGACKHANGRDWWIFVMRDINPVIYTILLNPNGIDTMFTQNLGYTANTVGNVSPIVFSPDGKKMIYCTPVNQSPSGTVLIYDFDRCSGMFSNLHQFPISQGNYLYGLAFSPSGKYAYACSSTRIFQIDTDSLTSDTVAVYDGFISPPTSTCCATTFWGMYLATDGKIYITSGSSVQHLHVMNFPDSAGLACDVQQHAIDLVDYLHLRAVPNHPNYYLGCDTTSGCPCLITGLTPGPSPMGEGSLRISPNPTSGNIKIVYLLPQNKSGVFEVFDINGKKVFSYTLPPWSTLQNFSLPHLADGMYQCIIKSANQIATQKIIIIRE